MSTRWSNLQLASVFLVLFCCVALFSARADWTLHFTRAYLPPGLSYAGVNGSVWHPAFERVRFVLPNGNMIAVNALEFRVAPWALFAGHLQGDWRWRHATGVLTGQLTLAPERWQITELSGAVPDALMVGPLGMLAALSPSAELYVESGQLTGADDTGVRSATLEIDLREVRLPALSGDEVLGRYHLSLEKMNDGPANGTVETVEPGSALLVDAQVSLQDNPRLLRLSGTARARSPGSRAVIALLGKTVDDTTSFGYDFPLP